MLFFSGGSAITAMPAHPLTDRVFLSFNRYLPAAKIFFNLPEFKEGNHAE